MQAPELASADPAALGDLARRALAHARDEAQVSVVRERSTLSRFARSAATQATDVDEVEISFLALRDGHVNLAHTNRTDDDSLRRLARRAEAGAAAAARAAAGRGPYPALPTPRPASGHEGYDATTATLAPDTPGRALAEAFAGAAEHGLEAFGVWTAGEVRSAIASSTGVDARDAVTDAYMKVICRDAVGRSGFASATAISAASIDARMLSSQAASKVARAHPVELPAGLYPVVFEPHAVASLLDFLGEMAFNGLAHAEGRGALAGRLGTRVAAPAINLSDSPRYPGTLPRAFDAEGVPKSPMPLIQDGVAQRVVHDTRSAARAGEGAHSSGHALAPGGTPDGPAPTNLVMAGGGAADEAELASTVERGIYVTRLWYVNPVDEHETLLTGMTRDGTFLIEDGAITRPLGDLRFNDSVLRLLSATEALTRRSVLISEGEFYGRRFAHGVACPALRASGFRVTAGASA